MIKKVGSKWKLFSKDGMKHLGTFASKKAAIAREIVINYFKHKKGKK